MTTTTNKPLKESDIWKEVFECWKFYAETGNHALICLWLSGDERIFAECYFIRITKQGICSMLSDMYYASDNNKSACVKAQVRLKKWMREHPDVRDMRNGSFLYPCTLDYAMARAMLATVMYEEAKGEEALDRLNKKGQLHAMSYAHTS